MTKPTRIALLLSCLTIVFSCRSEQDDGIKFSDVEQSQSPSIEDFSQLVFTDAMGKSVKLTDHMTHKYLVLVVTRGWTHSICLYCASQTSKWARRHHELEPYDAELVVIFPTGSDQDAELVEELNTRILDGPVANDSIPFPVFLDIDLRSVDMLGIRAELAKPATYIIDRSGRVRFAYVGQTIADHPSVDSILKQLSRMKD